MSKTMEIKIPLLIGSNGKWCAYGHGQAGQPHDCDDWGMLADNLMDWPGEDNGNPTDPETSSKHYVTTTVEIPDGVIPVAGAVVSDVK